MEEEESLIEIPQMQYIDKMVDDPVVQTVQVPHVQIVEKLIKIPQLQTVEQIVVFPDIPKIQTGHTVPRLPRTWKTRLFARRHRRPRWLRSRHQFLLNHKLLTLWWIASNPLPEEEEKGGREEHSPGARDP